ncbi:MAG: transposase, partial [Gemmataceae bacterium]
SLCVSPGHRRVDLLTAFFPGRSLVQEDLIDHFQKLRRRFRRPLVVVLDNLRSHKGRALTAWCERVGDVHLRYLPPYAPELNPIEWAWSHSKCHGMRGRVAHDLKELVELAQNATAQASTPSLLRSYLRAVKYPLDHPTTRKDQSLPQ